MTKTSALGSGFIVGVYDLSGDIGALSSMDLSQSVQDVSPINVEGTERLGLRLDGSLGYDAFWDPDPAHAVPVLSDLGGPVQVSYLGPGTGVGRWGASLIANVTRFTSANAQDGSLAVSGEAMGSGGVAVEWGRLLTAGKETIATAGNGTAVDRGVLAATDFGMAAYLHVLSLGSGSAGVKVQDSANGTTGWADVVAFTTVTGPVAQRVASATTENVKQFLRLVTTGVFTNLVAVVIAIPYSA